MQGPSANYSIVHSIRLRFAVAALHVLAAAAVLLAELPGWLRIIALAGLAGHLIWSTRPDPAVVLRCRVDGGMQIRVLDDWRAVEVLPDTVVMAWLVVLRYRVGARAATVLILPDSLGRDEFRRLRVWLKWRATLPGPAARA